MKRFAGMLALALATAAQSQTPSSDQEPTPTAPPSASAAASVPTANVARFNGAGATAGRANADEGAGTQASGTQPNVDVANDAGSGGGHVGEDRADVVQAISYLKSAAADFTNCRRASACKAYFDSFGVAIPFADGSIVPFSHVQRLSATSRECVKKAKALQEEGNRSLAVQWAMAARIENRTIRDWLGNHPDAVLEALRQVTVL